MTEQTDEVEININHPWVTASVNMNPQPVPTGLNLDAVEFTMEGQRTKAALLSIVDPTGVKTVFIPPQMLEQMLHQIGSIFQQWQLEASQRIVVADKNTERAVINEQKFHNKFREN